MKIKEKISQFLYQVITYLEIAIATLLVVFVTLGTGYLLALLIKLFKTHLLLTPKEIHGLLDVTLTLFIVIELFRTVLAYIAGHKVLKIVFEAAFVALARKIVLFDLKDYTTLTSSLMAALAIGFLLISLALAYLTMSRSQKNN